MSFAENVKQFRTRKGLTQEELGERVGISGQAVSKWEVADSYPDPSLLPALADALEVTIDELFGHETRTRERLAKETEAYLRSLPAEERTRALFGLCAEAFRSRLGRGATGVSVSERRKRESWALDRKDAAGALFSDPEFSFLTLALEPETEDGWGAICRDAKTAEFLEVLGDPDVLKCVLWLLGREPRFIEAELIPERAGADPGRTDEILEKLELLRAVSVGTFPVNGTPRRIADCMPSVSIDFKGPVRSLLAAAWAFANGNAGIRHHANDTVPPLAK